MRMAITEQGNAYVVPGNYSGVPKWVYGPDEKGNVLFYHDDVSPRADGAEKVTRHVANVVNSATHYDCVNQRIHKVDEETAIWLENNNSALRPIIKGRNNP